MPSSAESVEDEEEAEEDEEEEEVSRARGASDHCELRNAYVWFDGTR